MNQAAKDAVGVIEILNLLNQSNYGNVVLRKGYLGPIIAGIELLRGVAEGSHVIVPAEKLDEWCQHMDNMEALKSKENEHE